MPMSPRLTSRTTSAPAARQAATVRSSTAMPRDPYASKNADCGLITAAVSANASTQMSAKRARPSTSSVRPHASSSAGCGSMPTHSEPRSSSAASSRVPKRHARDRQSSSQRARVVGQVRVADGVGEARRSRARPGLLEFGEHADRRGRVAEHRRADRHGRRAGEDELERVEAGADAAHAEDRQVRQGIACTCHTQRTATGRIAGPDSPPVTPPSAGRIVSVSITSPSRVLISEKPSTPASAQARAMSVMSVTSGESLANTGWFGSAARRTAPITRDDAMASQANTWPRLSTFGQEMLTSSIDTAGCPASRRASSTYSSVCAAGDRDDRARAVLGQPGQVVLDERRRCPGPAGRSS